MSTTKKILNTEEEISSITHTRNLDPEGKQSLIKNTANDTLKDKEAELSPVTQVLCKKKSSKSSIEIDESDKSNNSIKRNCNKNAQSNLTVKSGKSKATYYKKPANLNQQGSHPKSRTANGKQAMSDISFEMWKNKKNEVYRRIFKEERRKLYEEEEAAKIKETEHKLLSHRALCRWKRQHEYRPIQDTNKDEQSVSSEEEEEKRRKNKEAYNAWKAKKDLELRKKNQKLVEYKKYYEAWLGKNATNSEANRTNARRNCPTLNFDDWLNRLDQVLHQKYMRERRYRTRSFYCQPVYFGAAADYQRSF